jgi:hypothetical protein
MTLCQISGWILQNSLPCTILAADDLSLFGQRTDHGSPPTNLVNTVMIFSFIPTNTWSPVHIDVGILPDIAATKVTTAVVGRSHPECGRKQQILAQTNPNAYKCAPEPRGRKRPKIAYLGSNLWANMHRAYHHAPSSIRASCANLLRAPV